MKTVEGPILTTLSSELETPVLLCAHPHKSIQCEHLGIHDGHYYYCAAQQKVFSTFDLAAEYPWSGAGTHLVNNRPNDTCPFQGNPNVIEE